MRKRKIPDNMPILDHMPGAEEPPKWNANAVVSLLTQKNREYTTEERDLLVALTLLIRNRILPDDYDILFQLLSPNTTLINLPGTLPPIHHQQIPPEIIALIKALPDNPDNPSSPADDLPFTFDP